MLMGTTFHLGLIPGYRGFVQPRPDIAEAPCGRKSTDKLLLWVKYMLPTQELRRPSLPGLANYFVYFHRVWGKKTK